MKDERKLETGTAFPALVERIEAARTDKGDGVFDVTLKAVLPKAAVIALLRRADDAHTVVLFLAEDPEGAPAIEVVP